LGSTSINGDLTIDGTLSIENGNEINVFGTLYLQKSFLADNIDIFNGAVTIDSSGNISTTGVITASEVKTDKVTVTNSASVLSATIGTGTIAAGSTSLVINTTEVNSTSKIFITPRSKIGTQALVVESVIDGESFEVTIDHSLATDANFDWWIVDSQ
jgi:hypothetical protein